MIKFKYIIHKETGTVIKYEDWEKRLGLEMWFILVDETKQFNYKPKEMLFSDDFEIIYNSCFTNDDLKILNECVEFSMQEYPQAKDICEQHNLVDKIELILRYRKEICKDKYRIEV